MKLNKIGLPTHIEEKVVEIIKQQLPSIQVDSIGDKLMFEYSRIIVGRLTSEELTTLRACLRAAEYDEEDVKMFMKQRGRPAAEKKEPKESALKESVEQVKESVKVLTDSVKDAISETISENVIADYPIAIDKEAFDPHTTISSEQIKEVGTTDEEPMDIFQCMDGIKLINQQIKEAQCQLHILEDEKKYLKDRVAKLLDEV